jgi:transcription-repair coupling factor (superfamily II helicase)
MSTTARRKVAGLQDLVPLLRQSDGFAAVAASLRSGASAAIDGAWGSSCALTGAALAGLCPQTLLVVLPRVPDVDDFADDFAGFRDAEPLGFPAWETLPQEHDVADAVFGARLRVLRALSGTTPPKAVITSFPALLQPVPSRTERDRGTRHFRVGDEIALDDLLGWLVERGFRRMPAIAVAGEFSMHGGIVDIFPPDAEDPLRFEFFGDEIESIRRFDVETQRKLEDLSEAELTIVAPESTGAEGDASRGGSLRTSFFSGESLLDSLPAASWVVLVDLPELVQEGKQYLDRLDHPRGLFAVDTALARCTQFPSVTVAGIAADSLETTCHLNIESIERFTGPRSAALEELATVVASAATKRC